jgi:tyrosyl-tRNA synthetase
MTDAERYIKIFTSLDKDTIDALVEEHKQDPGMRVLQKRLADEVTTMVHSRRRLMTIAKEASNILFGKSTKENLLKLDEQTLLMCLPACLISIMDKSLLGQPAVDMFTVKAAPVFASKGEMRKLVQKVVVSLNKEKVQQFDRPVTAEDLIDGKYLLVQKGKKKLPHHYLLDRDVMEFAFIEISKKNTANIWWRFSLKKLLPLHPI